MLEAQLINILRKLDFLTHLVSRLLDDHDDHNRPPLREGFVRVSRIGPYQTKEPTMANQDPGTVNSLTSDQHVIVEFETDTSRGIDVAVDGVPALAVSDPALATAVLVPAPTEGAGRFAFDFTPVDGAVGDVQVTITADARLGADVANITRTVMFDILPLEATLINVTVRAPEAKTAAAAPPPVAGAV